MVEKNKQQKWHDMAAGLEPFAARMHDTHSIHSPPRDEFPEYYEEQFKKSLNKILDQSQSATTITHKIKKDYSDKIQAYDENIHHYGRLNLWYQIRILKPKSDEKSIVQRIALQQRLGEKLAIEYGDGKLGWFTKLRQAIMGVDEQSIADHHYDLLKKELKRKALLVPDYDDELETVNHAIKKLVRFARNHPEQKLLVLNLIKKLNINRFNLSINKQNVSLSESELNLPTMKRESLIAERSLSEVEKQLINEHRELKNLFGKFLSVKKANVNFYRDKYRTVRKTFEAILFSPYISKIYADEYDKQTSDIIFYLNRIGGRDYIAQIYNHFFPEKITQSSSGDDLQRYKARLQGFSDYLAALLLDMQETDFQAYGYNISEAYKRDVMLRLLKLYINRFASDKKLNFSIKSRSEYDWRWDTCADLLTQLAELRVKKAHLFFNDEQYCENRCESHVIEWDAITKERDRIQAIENYNKRIEEEKKLLVRIQNLNNELLRTLRATMAEFREPIHKFDVQAAADVYYDKYEERKKKTIWDAVSIFATWMLSLGQAALGAYALIYLFPIFGGPLTPIFATVAFFCTLGANYVLFKGSLIKTLRRLFVKGDWWGGFTSTEGKALMGIALLSSVVMATTMAILALKSVHAAMLALGLVFPPALPVITALIIPVVGVISLTTFLGYTSLMYVTISKLINKACEKLEYWFPQIRTNGWGWHGLKTGIREGVSDWWRRRKEEGLANYIKRHASNVWGYIKNPTTDENASVGQVVGKHLENIFRYSLRVLLYIGAIALFAVASIATFLVWRAEVAGFFMSYMHVPAMAADILSLGFFVSISITVKAIFTLRNNINFSDLLMDASNALIVKPVKKLVQYITDIPNTFTDAISFVSSIFTGNKTQYQSHLVNDCKYVYNKYTTKFNNYCSAFKTDPLGSIWSTLVSAYELTILPVFIFINGAASGALVEKSAVIPNELEFNEIFEPEVGSAIDLSDIDDYTHVQALAYATSSDAANYSEAVDYVRQKLASHLPYREVKQQQLQQQQYDEAKLEYDPAYLAEDTSEQQKQATAAQSTSMLHDASGQEIPFYNISYKA